LINVISDVLDFSKIESGHLELDPHDFNLRKCIDEVISTFANESDIAHLKLHYSLSNEIPLWLKGDSMRLKQILINLIGNAIKFTGKGEVFLEITPINKNACGSMLIGFKIKDTGIGIPKDKLSRLFKAFTQVDSSTTRKYGGTGLGLAICERLVKLMDGEISAESIQGGGSCFYFTVKMEWTEQREVMSYTSNATQLLNSHFATEYPLRILIAEDNLINQKLAVRILTKLGYEPLVANNGAEALQMTNEGKIDVIFMDIQMPEMDGLQATKAIRASTIRQPAIIAMTANAMVEDKERCLAAGMDDYLAKPVHIEQLIGRLVSSSLRGSLN